jgi:hypothetical protein
MDNANMETKNKEHLVNASRFAACFDMIISLIFWVIALINKKNVENFWDFLGLLSLGIISFFFYIFARYEAKNAAMQDRALQNMIAENNQRNIVPPFEPAKRPKFQ